MKKLVFTLMILGVLGAGGYYFYLKNPEVVFSHKTPQESDEYVRFAMEAYDSILQNYWADQTQYNLPDLYRLSLEKVSGKSFTLSTSTREATAQMVFEALNASTSPTFKKDLVLNSLIVVLYNLQPAGRNGILSTKEETAMRQNVSNINPQKDLYQDLGVEKGATVDQVVKAFEKKDDELKSATSTEAVAEREKIAYAKKVLTNNDSKTLYDQNQIEPTVFSHKLGNTLYLYFSKISPTTFMEFARAVDNASTTKNYNSMILDMRGNVGGSLDFVQNFLGLFVGPNQYAFDLFHQGKYDAQRTVQPKFTQLDRFKEVAIITDNMTQSTAEVISATFKRLRLGKTVGTNTRGWGTVENTYPINTVIDDTTKYSLFLVNSITLREDNQPIEGRGVDPDVATADADWKTKLKQQFSTPSLIEALSNVAKKPPMN